MLSQISTVKMLIVQGHRFRKDKRSISIVDVLKRHNYVKIFCSSQTEKLSLVKQAKNNYTNLLPDLSCCNLLDNKDDPEVVQDDFFLHIRTMIMP